MTSVLGFFAENLTFVFVPGSSTWSKWGQQGPRKDCFKVLILKPKNYVYSPLPPSQHKGFLSITELICQQNSGGVYDAVSNR